MGTRLISPFIFQPTKGKVEFRSFAVGFNVQRGTIGLSEPGVHVDSWRGTPENALFIQSLKRWMPLLACIVQNNKFTEFQYLTWYHLKLTSIPWIDTTREHLPRSTNDRRRCTTGFPVQYLLSRLWRRFRPTQHGCSLQKYHFRAMCWHIYCNSVRGAKNVSFTWTRHAGITWVITVHSPCHVCWASQKADLWPVTIDSRHSDSSCSPSEKRRLVGSSSHVSKQHDFVKIIEIVTCL